MVMREIIRPNVGEKFSDPIVLPNDAPIPANVRNFKLVSRGQFEQAEMAAFDELPQSLKNAFRRHSFGGIMQLIVKGLKFGEFSEDQVYMAILQRAPRPLKTN